MVRSRFTHASVLAEDLEESVRFYEEVFGMERVPSPTFPNVEVEWLRCGELTLHLFDREIEAADYYHVGLHVDDFERVYEAARERGLLADFDEGEGLPTVYELPEGAVQMYIHDPADNLVEVNHHDVSDLPDRIRTEVVRRSDQIEQTGDSPQARLYFEEVLADLDAGAAPDR